MLQNIDIQEVDVHNCSYRTNSNNKIRKYKIAYVLILRSRLNMTQLLTYRNNNLWRSLNNGHLGRMTFLRGLLMHGLLKYCSCQPYVS